MPRHSRLFGRGEWYCYDNNRLFQGLVPHDQLFTKLAASGVDSRVVVWVMKSLVGRTQAVGGQISEEVKVNAGVP